MVKSGDREWRTGSELEPLNLKEVGRKSVWLVRISRLFRSIEKLLAFKVRKSALPQQYLPALDPQRMQTAENALLAYVTFAAGPFRETSSRHVPKTRKKDSVAAVDIRQRSKSRYQGEA
jgi:hypothetical protein